MYKSLSRVLREYFRQYGGVRAIVTSPYFHLALVLTALSYKIWGTEKFADLVTSVVPAILGFTIAAFTILFSLTTGSFFDVLVEEEEGDKPSPFAVVVSTFTHFIVVQFVALVLSLLVKAGAPSLLKSFVELLGPNPCVASSLHYLNILGSAFLCLVFFYAVSLALATALNMYRFLSLIEVAHKSGSGKK